MNRHDTWIQRAALVLGGVLACTATPAVAGAGIASPAVGSMAAQLESHVRALFDSDLAPGMQVAVVKDGAIVYAQAFGVTDVETQRPVGLDTEFYIASTTKSLTALAAASLAAKGKVDLDAPISRTMPRLHLQAPLSADSISLRDLLTHTHGISNDGPVTFRTAFTGDYTKPRLLALLEQHGEAKGGRAFRYGNIGYNVAGMVLEAATGSDWKTLVEREVLTPAGMTHTTAYRSRAGNDVAMPHWVAEKGFRRVRFPKNDATMHAAGGHLASATDLARYLEAQLNHGRIDGRQVFPNAVIEETHRQQATQDRRYEEYHRYGWGLGWDLGTYEADTLLHRFGSFYNAFHSHVSFMPRRGVGVVVLVNDGTTGPMLVDWVANSIYDILLEKPGAVEKWNQVAVDGPAKAAEVRAEVMQDRARRAERPQTTAHPLRTYVGTYEHPLYGRMSWTLERGRLIVRMGVLESDTEVFDGTKDQIRVELTGGGEVVTFACEGGKAVALVYHGERFVRR
jgi:CubicO group peptidase (beta-lactamase class C family)